MLHEFNGIKPLIIYRMMMNQIMTFINLNKLYINKMVDFVNIKLNKAFYILLLLIIMYIFTQIVYLSTARQIDSGNHFDVFTYTSVVFLITFTLFLINNTSKYLNPRYVNKYSILKVISDNHNQQ